MEKEYVILEIRVAEHVIITLVDLPCCKVNVVTHPNQTLQPKSTSIETFGINGE